MNFRELNTILSEIELMINLRPLSYVDTDPNELRSICPADLIFGIHHRINWPDNLSTSPQWSSAIVYSKRWKYQQTLLRYFKKRFRETYLQYLNSLHKNKPQASRPLQVGDVCILHSPEPSRGHWPLCRILSLSGGERTDLRKRSCLIKTAKGQIFKRPINLLYKLEVA